MLGGAGRDDCGAELVQAVEQMCIEGIDVLASRRDADLLDVAFRSV